MIDLHLYVDDIDDVRHIFDRLANQPAGAAWINGVLRVTYDLRNQADEVAQVPESPSVLDRYPVGASFERRRPEEAPEVPTVVARVEPDPEDEDSSTLSCADAIVALLEGEPDEQLTAAEVAAELPRWTKGTVGFTLATLYRDGRIGRPARGKYQAAS